MLTYPPLDGNVNVVSICLFVSSASARTAASDKPSDERGDAVCGGAGPAGTAGSAGGRMKSLFGPGKMLLRVVFQSLPYDVSSGYQCRRRGAGDRRFIITGRRYLVRGGHRGKRCYGFGSGGRRLGQSRTPAPEMNTNHTRKARHRMVHPNPATATAGCSKPSL